jgi:hypothetical protein
MNTAKVTPRITSFPEFEPAPPRPVADLAESSPVGALAFWVCAAYTFLLFSRTVEFIDSYGKMHLALISGLVCILALLVTGTIPRLLISPQGRWITLFCFWIFVGLPFSSWKGGSISAFVGVWLKSYMSFFIVGGLIFTLKQFRLMAAILAFSTVGQVYLSFRSGVEEANRLTMAYGTLGNSNDLASALLMGLPFILLFVFDRYANPLLRVLFVPVSVLVLIAVLKTGSRGGLVALAVMVAFVFFKASPGQKVAIGIASLCLILLFAAVVPSSLRSRYMTIFKSDRSVATTIDAESALESSYARKELFKNTFILTYRHPIFGVGLAQFSPQSFNLFVERGISGLWFTSHDIFGLVSAETGVPGLIFFCGLLISTYRGISRLTKIPPATPELAQIARMSNAILISLVAYTACGVFNTQAYSHQLPVMAALAATLTRIAKPYIAASAPAPQIFPAPPPFVNRRLAQRNLPVTP